MYRNSVTLFTHSDCHISKLRRFSLLLEDIRRKEARALQISAVTRVRNIDSFRRSELNSRSVIQWGLTPQSARSEPDYHPSPAFLHAILAKHRWNLQPDKLFSHIRRPRLDGSREPLLVRTLYEYTGDCFALTLKGPDGALDAENSMQDGQGVVMESMEDALGNEAVWEELRALSEVFVRINHNE